MQSYWDSVAAEYTSLYESPWYRLEDRHVAHELAQLSMRVRKRSFRVLDLGCGAGLGRRLLEQAAPGRTREYVGVDISARMLEQFSPEPGVTLHQGDALAYANGTPAMYDIVMSLFTTGSFLSDDAATTITAATHAVAPGGVLYMSFLGRFALHGFTRHGVRGRVVYRTRGTAYGGVPACRVSRSELRRAGRRCGLSTVGVSSLGPLVGVVERPALWRVNQRLARSVPLNHTLALTGQKP